MTDAPAVPTLAAIRAAMDALGQRPSKRFGQNFLADPALLARIADDAEPCADDVVLEVGPGPGALTAVLLARAGRVVAVEVDRSMRELLTHLLGSPARLSLIAADILSAGGALPDPVQAALDAARTALGRASFLLIANLPYQVAATLLPHMVWRHDLARAVVTIQREVAERLCAAPGSRAYGPVSVMVQTRARVRVTRHLAAGAFWPRPAVASAVVRLDPHAQPPAVAQAPLRAAVRALFFARRKRAAGSLVLACPALDARAAEALLHQAGIDPGRRGETLAPHEFVPLAHLMQQRLGIEDIES